MARRLSRALLIGILMAATSGCSRSGGTGNDTAATNGESPGPATKTISGLLAADDAATARIAAASAPAGTPVRLDHMLVTMRGISQQYLLDAGLRGLQPFNCIRVDAVIDCTAAVANVNGSAMVGALTVRLYDHDRALDDGKADLTKLAPQGASQALSAFDPGIQVTGHGHDTHYAGSCQQSMNATTTGPIACAVLLDARTEILAVLATTATGGNADFLPEVSDQDTKRADALLLGTADLVNRLRAVATKPDGDFDESALGLPPWVADYRAPGWYVARDGIFSDDNLAGPYRDQQSCNSVTSNVVATAMMLGWRGGTDFDCRYLDHAQ